jgi:hypothetical protein
MPDYLMYRSYPFRYFITNSVRSTSAELYPFRSYSVIMIHGVKFSEFLHVNYEKKTTKGKLDRPFGSTGNIAT